MKEERAGTTIIVTTTCVNEAIITSTMTTQLAIFHVRDLTTLTLTTSRERLYQRKNSTTEILKNIQIQTLVN
jgi:hypothetical protein